MAKDLQWFKFIISEWVNGDIKLCSLEAQGLFVNVMVLYWSRECELSIEKMRKHIPATAMRSVTGEAFGHSPAFQELLSEDVIKIDGDCIRIHFMDEQKANWHDLSKAKSEAGKLGGRGVKASTKADTKASNKAPDKADLKQAENQAPKQAESYRDKNKILMPTKIGVTDRDSLPNRQPSAPALRAGSGVPPSKYKIEFFEDIENYKFSAKELVKLVEEFDFIPPEQEQGFYMHFRRAYKTEDNQKKRPTVREIVELMDPYQYFLSDEELKG